MFRRPMKPLAPSILVEQTESLPRHLEDLALVEDYIIAPGLSRRPSLRTCSAGLGLPRSLFRATNPRLRNIRGTFFGLDRRDCPAGRFLKRRGACSVGYTALDPGGHAEAASEGLAQGIRVPVVPGEPGVDRQLLGVGQLEHLPVEALDPRLLVNRRRRGLAAVPEILHHGFPLGRQIRPPVRPLPRLRTRRLLILQFFSLRNPLLRPIIR